MGDEHEDKPWYSQVAEGVENFAMPAVHVGTELLEGAAGATQASIASVLSAAGPGMQTAEEAAVAAEEIAPGLGPVADVMPGIGAALGIGQAAYHGYEAYNTTGTEHWNQTGEATLGGINAAASFCPEAGLYVGAGELAINGVGALSHMLGGPDFNAGSVVGGIEHGAVAGAEAIGGAASSAASWVGDLF